jgi:hypothetical protein
MFCALRMPGVTSNEVSYWADCPRTGRAQQLFRIEDSGASSVDVHALPELVRSESAELDRPDFCFDREVVPGLVEV